MEKIVIFDYVWLSFITHVRKNEEIVNFISRLEILNANNSKRDGKFLGIFKF